MQQKYIYIPLSEPIPINEQVWPEGTLPLVSICSITYNHEPFIRECLEGFLMQKTTFPVEIIIHDDASTDKTAEIIKEYELKYPNLFKPIYQVENQFSKKQGSIYARFVYPKVIGKYIALCEGDDYWIDPLKLQKQVDFLEANPEYVLTSHQYAIYDYEKQIYIDNSQRKLFKKNNGLSFNQSYALNHDVTKTLTLLYRYSALRNSRFTNIKFKYSRDTIMVYFLMTQGLGYCFKDIMGCYNLNENSIYGKVSKKNRIKSSFLSVQELYRNTHSFNSLKLYCNVFIHYVYYSKGKALFIKGIEPIVYFSFLYFLPYKTIKFTIKIFNNFKSRCFKVL
mgnify:CR=1 FL=1|jgi:glycosyltransferase involved in cell wall biosynthesis